MGQMPVGLLLFFLSGCENAVPRDIEGLFFKAGGGAVPLCVKERHSGIDGTQVWRVSVKAGGPTRLREQTLRCDLRSQRPVEDNKASRYCSCARFIFH